MTDTIDRTSISSDPEFDEVGIAQPVTEPTTVQVPLESNTPDTSETFSAEELAQMLGKAIHGLLSHCRSEILAMIADSEATENAYGSCLEAAERGLRDVKRAPGTSALKLAEDYTWALLNFYDPQAPRDDTSELSSYIRTTFRTEVAPLMLELYRHNPESHLFRRLAGLPPL